MSDFAIAMLTIAAIFFIVCISEVMHDIATGDRDED